MGEEAARRWTAAELRELPLSTPRPVLRSAAAAAAAAAGLTPAQLGDVDPPLPDPGLPGCEVAEMDEVVPRVWLGSWRAAADGAVQGSACCCPAGTCLSTRSRCTSPPPPISSTRPSTGAGPASCTAARGLPAAPPSSSRGCGAATASRWRRQKPSH
eukprot:TRINITY_DN16038_c0_g1_i2.p2 TRINITY_DN16038_c0_g1~~TRINITY_DN16038_c0_g1_i2.p2  ORF type:complete len:183 (+),score=26.40 TRINITY_DN16038_c0_g1_i2:81-551(+)